jgi:beta-barrel assembly-enhancing protease
MRTLTALVATAAIALSAAPARADQFKPSRDQQVKLGTQAAAEIRKKEKVLPEYDPRVRLVRRIGNKILGTIDLKDQPWKFSFDVIESKQVNAFALPGGPTFVYTGLLDKLESEDELAGVMAHELTHTVKEHWAKQYASNQKRQLGIGILLGVLRANSAWQNVGGLVNALEATKFSRSEENQADQEGFKHVVSAGYNPEGMVDVFRMFQKMKSGGQGIPFLASHPSDKSRIENLQKLIRASNQTFPPQRPLIYQSAS